MYVELGSKYKCFKDQSRLDITNASLVSLLYNWKSMPCRNVMVEQQDKDFDGQKFEVEHASIAGATFLSPATPAT